MEFAGRCEAAGIAFLGPTTDTMNMFSLKHTARAIAEEAKVCALCDLEASGELHEQLRQ